MTKPTLDDFIKDPKQTMRQGYYPDFMSVGAMLAESFNVSGFDKLILNNGYKLLHDEVINFPKNFLILILSTIIFFSIPFLFPVWWVFFVRTNKIYFEQIAKQEERLYKLL